MGFFMRKAQPYSISFHARSAGFASVCLRVPQSHYKHAPQLTASVSIVFHCHPIFSHMPSLARRCA